LGSGLGAWGLRAGATTAGLNPSAAPSPSDRSTAWTEAFAGYHEHNSSAYRFLTYICSIEDVKLTAPLERVLRVFLDDPAEPRYGYDLMKAAALPSGTLYPLLSRLESRGMVTSAWETPQEEGQRPRRYYQLTGEGVRVARLELAQASAARRSAPAKVRRPAPGTTQ
jgi:DNA-binding PadR family transcriptional regulator